MNGKLPLVIFLMGPTASGKTTLSIKISKKIPVEIISVDSGLIYKGMDIGTAKPSSETLEKIPHKLIDIRDPNERYSVADFYYDAMYAIHQTIKNGKVPLLVGGTMFYYRSLIKGLSFTPASDLKIRSQIKQEALNLGCASLHKQLKKIDPISANRIHCNDLQRLSRALEIYRISGKTLTEYSRYKYRNFPFHVKQFALAPNEKDNLHHRIEVRFHNMIKNGFENEVKALHSRNDLHLDLPSIRCVGYRQIWDYLNGNLSLDEAIFRGICATRRLAKRQMTWLRSWCDLTWLNSENMEQAVETILNKVNTEKK
ncbi:tRNA dimethylallyltransferase [Candidatus Photodesmus katoptron]|uniref:tRNA dimethylallyltransferase n=1 Tax=Candidatus Photodesmus katoptron Akat1 TaxID=1236703 RepID=S3E1E2_9GAMM|nr:tRNA (adenosine(37)-N6)-dimethylallyltransferase MiaA [Candidatus Photodesmus katoptron]EPE38001.1 tRNA delta(2)-isopentenylpyrophosphate transferase [Candidatus Photodesmus katoptron Akat1]KEY90741.1 tRNA dimethylallyltransferase [Candidatus Photodesmus katoptron]